MQRGEEQCRCRPLVPRRAAAGRPIGACAGAHRRAAAPRHSLRRRRPLRPRAADAPTPRPRRSFTGLASCADCDLFEEIVKNEPLVADCKACCVKGADDVRYTQAVLEVCPYRKSGLPQVRFEILCFRQLAGGAAGGCAAQKQCWRSFPYCKSGLLQVRRH